MEETSFSTWLRKRRRSLDLSRQALADRAGCAEITLRRIEAGTLKPSKELASILLEKVGIPERERLQLVAFARGLSEIPSDSLPASRPLTNLPASLTSFIGREKEQAEIFELLRKHRLVTLTGSGGVGKTRLSLKVGGQALVDYPDGVWLAELASLNDPELLPETVAKIFGVKSRSNAPVTESLTEFLRAKNRLFILDNCEHLLEAYAHLAHLLLKNCPNLKILATSREALGIPGEAAYRVPSLELPDIQNAVDEFRRYESVRLFEERAQLAQTDFALTLENASSVAQICLRLDGIPLAIELAAARVDMLSTEQIAAQLKERFHLLTSGSRVALPRQQTIRASIDWSWNVLTDSERALLRRLSVFAGGWTLDSAKSVCADTDIEPHQVFDLITQLAAKSLVLANQDGRRGTRYHMLETIREYALEKLGSSGEMQTVCLRHLTFFAEMVEEAERNFKGPDQALWYSRLDHELDNLRVALTWFDGIENAETRLRFAAGLWRYWKIRGLINEGSRHLQRTLDGLPLGSTRQTPGYARALIAVGALAYYEGDYSYSLQSRKEALAIFRKLEDKVGIADCLNGLGNVAISQGDYDSTRAFYEEGLLIRKELGDTWGVARLLGNLGLLACFQLNYPQAHSLHLESLSLFREVQDDEGAANELTNLGDVARFQGNLSSAQSFYKQSAAVARKLKDQWGLPYAVMGMADIAFERGEFSLASSLYRESLALLQKGADRCGLPFALESVAALACAKNQAEKAARLLGAAEALRKSTNSPLPPPNRPVYQKNLTTLQQQLDPSAFEVAWEEGRAMTFEEVVAYALGED